MLFSSKLAHISNTIVGRSFWVFLFTETRGWTIRHFIIELSWSPTIQNLVCTVLTEKIFHWFLENPSNICSMCKFCSNGGCWDFKESNKWTKYILYYDIDTRLLVDRVNVFDWYKMVLQSLIWRLDPRGLFKITSFGKQFNHVDGKPPIDDSSLYRQL